MKARKVLKGKEVKLKKYMEEMKLVHEDDVPKETDEGVYLLAQVERELEAVSIITPWSAFSSILILIHPYPSSSVA